MKQSDFPTKISVPFASGAGNAYIRQIPTASQISTDPGAASLTDGFPPQTFQPLGSGGTPQDGRDVNGILNMTSAVDQAFCAGNWPQFDAAFATAIGGYPAGAVLAGSTPGQFWVSTADNNTTVPGASGATWQSLFAGLAPARGSAYLTSSGSFTVPNGVYKLRIRAWGGGGGGGGAGGSASSGCGGTSGGYCEGYVSVTPGTTISYLVGANGAGGGTGGTAGQGGGYSAFGPFSAGGGNGGPGSASGAATWSTVPTGGSATGADLNIPGPGTANAYQIGSGFIGSEGATAPMGGSGGYQSVGNGSPGVFPGGGGGGAGANGTANSGGAGANGLVIVEW